MPTISLCMIVKNETNYIDACLKSVYDLVDEIIIVDTGSTDNTKEICKQYTDKVYDFKWVNDFSKARNYSFSKATGDFIMWLDADDVLLKDDRIKLLNLKQNLTLEDKAFSMIYDYAFDNNGNVTLSLRRNRLVRNEGKKDYWVGFVHEIIALSITSSTETDIHITHTRKHSNGTRNLELFENKISEGMVFDSRNTLYYAKELYYNGMNDKAIDKFNEFLDMDNIWIEDVIDVLVKMSDIYRMKNDIDNQRKYLYKVFDHAVRAEALYPLGLTYSKESKYDQAIYFFESILNSPFPENCSGFIKNDEWNIKPLIELSCCYYYKGNMELAKMYHNKAKEIDDNHPTVIYNDQFFK